MTIVFRFVVFLYEIYIAFNNELQVGMSGILESILPKTEF